MTGREKSGIVLAAEALAQEAMKRYDSSHDWQHVDRVRNLALKLAVQEGVQDLEVVEIAALLHDVYDAKYVSNASSSEAEITKFLLSHSFDSERAHKVVYVVENVSFSKEAKRDPSNPLKVTPELAVVQDADRLDALGAIGIARTFTFGGARSRDIYYTPKLKDTTTTDGNTKDALDHNAAETEHERLSSVGHFHDKLFKLKDMLKTESAKKEAQVRHDFMTLFLEHINREISV